MKVLVSGLGSIGKKHVEAIQTLDENAEIFALRSNHGNKNEISGVIDIYDLDEVDVTTLDFIIISNPTSEHFTSIKKFAAYNRPLFIEKPLFANTDADTQGLVEHIENKKIPTYIACNLRFLDCLQELKKNLSEKRIQEVNVYCGSYLPDWRPDVDFRQVYSAKKEMGGGVHIDLIHELDYVYWIFGEPAKTTSFFSSNSSLNISAYDYANYLWTYENFSASIILNYYRKDSKRTIEVVTDEGTYEADLLKNEIYLDKNSIFTSEQKVADTYLRQMNFFIKNILRTKNKFNTVSEANKVLKLCMQD